MASLRAAGERASAMLLAPAAAHLDAARVLVVADGVLQMVPFAALPDPRRRPVERTPLIADHEVIHLPSASTLALLTKDGPRTTPWPKSVMVFADPVFERDDPRIANAAARAPQRPSAGEPVHRGVLEAGTDGASTHPDSGDTTRQADAFGGSIPRLLGSRREARAIAALSASVDVTLDFAVTRDAVMSAQLANYRIIHFATHGIVDQVRPGLSGIILSLYDERGRGTPGFLRLHDIYNLNLAVDLVVLSACSTGVGKQVVGEGLIGLVRGFMYAGTRRVLATLWKVDDEASSELMTRFYRGVLQGGLGPSAALREAQLEMSRNPRWADPFYWAPFVLEGDWR
jgi:CHAT domain-containing protein